MQYDDSRKKTARRIIFALVTVFTVLLQNSASAVLGSFSVRPLAVIPLVICIAMFEREIAAALFGAFAGVLLDVSSAKDGFNTLLLIILCAVCSVLISHLMRNNLSTGMVLCAASLLVYQIIYTLVFVGAGGVVGIRAAALFYIPSFAASLPAIPIFYYLVKAVFKRFPSETY